MAVPRLEFGKTSLIGDAVDNGMSDLPDPDAIEYASPERAGIEEPSDDDDLTISDLTGGEVADKGEPTKEPSKSDSGEEEGDYAREPEGEETEGESESTVGDFAPELLTRAERYGYDAEAAKRFGSPENLQWAMAEADRVAAEWAQKQFEVAEANVPPAAPPQPQVQPPPAQPQAPTQFKLDKAKLAEQGFDDDTINLLSDMDGFYQQQMTAMQQLLIAHHQQLQQSTGQVQADEEAQFEQDLDAFFDKLGPDWEAEFGKGPMHVLKDNRSQAAQAEARRKLASTVFGLRFTDGQSNRQKETNAELAQRALNALHFKKQQEIARKALANTAGKRRAQAVARPGGQRTIPMTGEQKAIKRAEAFARKHRIGTAV